ncbi:MAG: cytochrome c oxidase subunit II [Erythrobacter sp.]|jgi:cytochrome c oxidase subunit 2|nr:cytochrome c oxidase subunit II [Erythrobacter sp.]
MGQMIGRIRWNPAVLLAALGALAFVALALPGTLAAQEPADEAAPATIGAEPVDQVAPALQPGDAQEAALPESAYAPMAPTENKGMPTSYQEDALASMTFQDQYSLDGAYALGMHDYILLPIITAISLLVLGLLLYVIMRYNRKRNPEPSKTTHNTLIEVVWTIVPVLILVVIAVPSITLLARQYETPPENAVTVKAIGYQWYWGYEYPDHGGFEVVSNMKSQPEALADGEPYQLAVDNRMVVPAGVPLRIQTTGADVIHSFAVPSLWFKQDAVPGRLNERILMIEEPGVYYGQCMELCGTLHGFMPIAVEALPMEEFEAWVLAQGGELPGAAAAEAQAEAQEAAEAPAVALAK